MLGYTSFEIAAIMAVYLGAAIVKGSTGLGFSTTCMPFLVLIVGLKEAMPLVIVTSVASNVVILATNGPVRGVLKRFLPLYIGLLPGLLLGLYLLDRLDVEIAVMVLGLALLGYAVFALARPDVRLPDRIERPARPVVGFATGLVNGLTGSQVFPVLPFLLSLNLTPSQFIIAINLSFTLSSVVMAAGLTRLGLMTGKALILSIAGIGIVYLGVWLGGLVRKRFSAEQFRIVVLIVLMAISLVLVGRGFL